MRPRLLTLALVLVASLTLSACGQEAQDEGGFQTEIAIAAETEGIYIDLDGLKYQVQVSRQLNPLIVNDRAYFQGLSDDNLQLAEDELWFGVWIRAANHADEPHRLAEDFAIRDSQENIYRPLEIAPVNAFAYRPGVVQRDEIFPDPNSVAGERSPNGGLLLFKVRRLSFDNRPLELVIDAPESDKKASVALDL